MVALEIALGVGWAITAIWATTIFLLQMIKIEELEQELKEVTWRAKNK